ncbi:MAG: hypothetical protein ABII09_01690 [Planctomycetota bacterium]
MGQASPKQIRRSGFRLRYRYAGHVAGQVKTDLALTLFQMADSITKIADHGYANNMHDEPSTVKKLQGLR